MSTYVITFESTHAAMAASKALAHAGLDYANIPTPTAISAGCGIAVRFETKSPDAYMNTVYNANEGSGASRSEIECTLYIKTGGAGSRAEYAAV